MEVIRLKTTKLARFSRDFVAPAARTGMECRPRWRGGRLALAISLWFCVVWGLIGTPARAANDPRILAQPRSGTISAGRDFGFNVLPGGTPPFLYQWFFEDALLPGETNIVLWLTGVTANQKGVYSVEVLNATGRVMSAGATLTVVDPAVLTAPVSTNVAAGANARFTVDAGGTPPLAYQWRFKGVNLAGQTNQILSLTNVRKDQSGAYSVRVSNTLGAVTSASATLTVNDPAILVHPLGAIVTGGDDVQFFVAAIGAPPLTYQWRFQGGLLKDQTNAVLQLANVNRRQSGNYSVQVRNALGTATSINAPLTVNDPVILTEPAGTQANQGDNVCFFVDAFGSQPLRYQWFFKGVTLAGETNRLLCLTGVTKAQSGDYTVRVTSEGGYLNSQKAALSVHDLSILTQPEGGSVAAGTDFVFGVEAAGTAPLTYQWFFNGAPLADATQQFLQLNSVTVSQGGDYSVRVANATGSLMSALATLVVNDPLIVNSPRGGTVVGGSDFDLIAEVEGTPPLIFQWHLNGAPLTDETNTLLRLRNVTVNQSGTYVLAATNPVGHATSSGAILTVLDPVVVGQPQGGLVAAGTNVTLSVLAAGTPPFSYQWFFKGTALPGATGAQLQIPNVTTAQSGDYSVRVSNAQGAAQSATATLTVDELFIITQPQGTSVAAGTNVLLDVVAGGTPPLSYQWRFMGNNMKGQTNAVLRLTNVTSAARGQYSVQVRNDSGFINSATATLSVADPAIQSQPRGGSAGQGESFQFSVEAAGTQPFTYQWYFKGGLMAGKVNRTLDVKNVTPSQAGAYTVQVRNALGRLTSAKASLTVTTTTSTATNAPRTLQTGEFIPTGPSQVELQLLLGGNGFENAVSFSMSYDPNVLANPVFVRHGPATVTTTPAAIAGRVGVEVQLPPGVTYLKTNAQEIGALRFDVLPGQDPLLGMLDFSNVPVAIAAADVSGNAMALGSLLRPSGSPVTSPPMLHEQSGLLTQTFLLSNPTAVSMTNLCVRVYGLNTDSSTNSISLFNSQINGFLDTDQDGQTDSEAYTVCVEPPGNRRFVILTLEYYVPDRTTLPRASFQSFFGSGLNLVVPRGAEGVRIKAARFIDDEFLLEFAVEENYLYYIQYAPTPEGLGDANVVKTSNPPVQRSGGDVQWIDNGPPRTDGAPEEGLRFYRVWRNPTP